MKFKDYDMYHSYYCGLCKCLKECYGIRGQMTLSFDMTFLIVLLTGLYEPKTQREVAKTLGISRSYVSRIEKKAVSKLEAALKDKNIEL